MIRKVVIWDFDGVIIDSKNLQIQALNECYKIMGKKDPPYDLFFSLSGDSLKNIFDFIGIPLSLIDIYTTYSSERIDQITVFEGIDRLLSELKEIGYGLAICTGKERKRTIEILKRFKLDHYFSIVVCSDDVENPKPSPESIIKCLDYFNVSSECAYMVGDAVNDILAARNAKVSSIGVLWGEGSASAIFDSGADYVCKSIDELKEIMIG